MGSAYMLWREVRAARRGHPQVKTMCSTEMLCCEVLMMKLYKDYRGSFRRPVGREAVRKVQCRVEFFGVVNSYTLTLQLEKHYRLTKIDITVYGKVSFNVEEEQN